MSVTVAPPQAPPSPPVEIEDGVIEEARRRHRRRRRRAAGIALGAGALVIAALVALLGGGDGGNSGAPGEPPPGGPRKLTLVRGRAFEGGQPALMGVTPSLEAGNVGVCIRVVSEQDCNGPLPTAAYPVYGGGESFNAENQVGPEGEIDALFTGPGVAAVRVAHLGTFKAQSAPGLPPGAKQIVFYRPPGSRGSVLPPGLSPQTLQSHEWARQGPALTETLLDASGRPIPVGKSPTFRLPNSYWQWPQAPPAQGRCAASSPLAGVRAVFGLVSTRIAPDPSITTPGWLSCLYEWFSQGGASYETAVLLNASSPGSPPAMLWGAIPLPGHPGMVEIPPVQREVHLRFPSLSRAEQARELAGRTKILGRAKALRAQRKADRLAAQLAGREQTYWDVFIPSTVARRVGPAWVLVRYGPSLAARIRFLETLHVTKIWLPHGQS